MSKASFWRFSTGLIIHPTDDLPDGPKRDNFSGQISPEKGTPVNSVRRAEIDTVELLGTEATRAREYAHDSRKSC
jgi:hypothetical protein